MIQLTLDQYDAIYNAMKIARKAWLHGSDGMANCFSERDGMKITEFQISICNDITNVHNEIMDSILREHRKFVKENKSRKSDLNYFQKMIHENERGCLVKTGVPEIDDIGMYAMFFRIKDDEVHFYKEGLCDFCLCGFSDKYNFGQYKIKERNNRFYLSKQLYPFYERKDKSKDWSYIEENDKYIDVVLKEINRLIEEGYLPFYCFGNELEMHFDSLNVGKYSF